MILYENALEIINSLEFRIQSDIYPLHRCRNHFLSSNITSLIDSPPFAKSAMDGYALPDSGESLKYRVESVIAAGDLSMEPLSSGCCRPIMTGAAVPPNTVVVIQVENCSEADGFMQILKPSKAVNIIRKGENCTEGEIVLTPVQLNAAHIGIAAASGHDHLPLASIPTAVVINTGSEITEVGDELPSGFIYNSNGPQISAQLEEISIPVDYCGIVKDDLQTLTDIIKLKSRSANLLILSGGVSAGRFDFVPEAAKAAGFEVLFHKVAIKPGKPILVARKEDTLLVGLPGNPVSGFVLFHMVIKPILARMQGSFFHQTIYKMTLLSSFSRKRGERKEFVPGKIESDGVTLLSYHGSSHLNGYQIADCLVEVNRNVLSIPKGERVNVIQLF